MVLHEVIIRIIYALPTGSSAAYLRDILSNFSGMRILYSDHMEVWVTESLNVSVLPRLNNILIAVRLFKCLNRGLSADRLGLRYLNYREAKLVGVTR
jgi:hypothetical protein